MKITSSLLFSVTLLALGASNAGAALIAYWNFNELSTTSSIPSNANQTTYSPTVGSGSVILAGWTSRAGATAPHGISNFGGTAVNVISPDPNGQSLALQAGTTSGTPNNGATMTIQVDLSGMKDVILTYATQRTNTGFNSNQFAYSTDGVSFTNFGAAYNPATSFALQTFDLSAISSLDKDSSVFFRVTFGGATTSSGNNRIDNIQVNATPVPETSAALLGALGVLGMLRRRR